MAYGFHMYGSHFFRHWARRRYYDRNKYMVLACVGLAAGLLYLIVSLAAKHIAGVVATHPFKWHTIAACLKWGGLVIGVLYGIGMPLGAIIWWRNEKKRNHIPAPYIG